MARALPRVSRFAEPFVDPEDDERTFSQADRFRQWQRQERNVTPNRELVAVAERERASWHRVRGVARALSWCTVAMFLAIVISPAFVLAFLGMGFAMMCAWVTCKSAKTRAVLSEMSARPSFD